MHAHSLLVVTAAILLAGIGVIFLALAWRRRYRGELSGVVIAAPARGRTVQSIAVVPLAGSLVVTLALLAAGVVEGRIPGVLIAVGPFVPFAAGSACPGRTFASLAHGTIRAVATRGAPHPSNTLNELSGEEWLYFTKSVWSTAYPSELGHAQRRAHGANKPPRLMARLIEFFTTSGELVLDPFAGVGGTLLGAAIARGPRRALGIEIEPRWLAVYKIIVRDLLAERDGLGPILGDLGSADPVGVRQFDPSGCEVRLGDALALLPTLPAASIDFVATDPPYNVQLPITMSGGRLAEAHANRRTDYAMVTGDPADFANSPDYGAFLDRMEVAFGELARVLRPGRYMAVIVRDAYQDGRYTFTGADLASRASRVGFVPKGDLIWYQAGTRLRPYGYPKAFVPNIAHQHILIMRKA